MRFRRFRDLGRRICLALSAAILLAAPAAGDALDRLSVAHLAGSERLRLRAFGDVLERGVLPPAYLAQMRRDMTAQGHWFDGGAPQVVARRFDIAPVLGYDGNINGGVLQDRLNIGGLVFEADPAFRAKSGLVGGLSLGAQSRIAWAPGRLLSFAAGGELAWSPRHDIGRADAGISLCSNNHLTGWTFLDLCVAGARSWRQLDISNTSRLSLGIVQILALGEGLHEIGLKVEKVRTAGGPQGRVRIGAESIWNGVVTDFGVTFGEAVAGRTVLRHRIDAAVAWRAWSRDWRLDLWHQEASGSMFLGTPREDRGLGLGLSATLRPGVTARIGHVRNRSTAQIAQYEQVTLDLRFENPFR